MKILIGYNGSKASDDALTDLTLAGLPDDSETVLFTVVDERAGPGSRGEADALAANGAARLSGLFPNWKVKVSTGSGPAANEIVDMAGRIGANLIVIGESRPEYQEPGMSIGHSTQKILTEAGCSVRVARSRSAVAGPPRILLAFDGSRGSTLTVDDVSRRPWPNGTEVRLICAADASVLSAIGRFAPQMLDSEIEAKIVRQWSETLSESAIRKLRSAGLIATLRVEIGRASDVMIRQARDWLADAIFIGPNCSGGSDGKFLLGSVTTAVSWQAHCSVEIARVNGIERAAF
jgi:nucleotide-binding universal stress UspA family protein